jgi:two-component system KDP operon response regulator KdpE
VVILDLGLPDISGFDALKQIRLFSDVPIIILTVRADEADVVKGLEWGADDYMVKPFRQLELLARVMALARRTSYTPEIGPVSCGTMQLEPSTGQLTCGGNKVNLTPTESAILRQLMINNGNVVTHSNLAETVWGDDYPGSGESIKVYIRRLRQKIEQDPDNPELILTRAGLGYLLVKPE